MSLEQAKILEEVLDQLESLQDGKRHGEWKCGDPIGSSLYLKSWVIPKIKKVQQELLELGIRKKARRNE